jgi:hypothetical protein
LIDENRILDLNSRDLDESDAQSIAAGIALKRVYKGHGVRHAISFHRSIRAADRFREQQDALNRLRDIGPTTTNLHISSKKTAGQRSEILRNFVNYKRALMTNARCLTEGVDVPAIDCVMFADPKQSTIDIVQAAGRALRRHDGKEFGYIVVPLVVPDDMDFETFAETTPFRQVAQTITALSTQDERIADEFRAIEIGRTSNGKIVEIEGDVPVGMKMVLSDFVEAIRTRVWEVVGRANWKVFRDARAFVRDLGLNSTIEWHEYCQSGKKPADIPSNPNLTYVNEGWAGYGDWLGTGRVREKKWRPYKGARDYARRLKLASEIAWREYCQSGNKPPDIPAHPHDVYANDGWAGYSDWLGTGRVRRVRSKRRFKVARAYVHGLNLKSVAEWYEYCRSAEKPADIPADPRTVYANDGWTGYDDWLATGRNRVTGWRPFEGARSYVRRLKLKSKSEWREYCRSGKKPSDIPAGPFRIYANDGWAGYDDWLGTGRIWVTGWRPFGDARDFARNLLLKSRAEWSDYINSGNKPHDIPANPNTVYANNGWHGWGDWLGTGRVRGRGWRPFGDARAYVRGLHLKSVAEWGEYCRSGKKPSDIPAAPYRIYADDGWTGYDDWLGTGRVRRITGWRPLPDARAYVRRLKLKSQREWQDYAKSRKKPADIPALPSRTYANDGWVGWGDWLGYA